MANRWSGRFPTGYLGLDNPAGIWAPQDYGTERIGRDGSRQGVVALSAMPAKSNERVPGALSRNKFNGLSSLTLAVAR